MSLYIIHLLLMIKNAVEVVILLTIHMLKYTNKVNQKNLTVKVFNAGDKRSKFLFQHESYKCKCRLNKNQCGWK